MNDLISRQAAIDAIEKVAELYPWRVPGNRDSYSQYNEAWQDALNRADSEIEALPSAQQERKTGHWIKTARWGRVYYCDQCRNYLDFDGVNVGRGSANFCPNCGADMRGEQDG